MPTLPPYKPPDALRTRPPTTTRRGPAPAGPRTTTNNGHRTPATHCLARVDAPRDLVYQAFTDPDQLAAWWGPIGNALPRDEIDFDVRPGGYQRWTEVRAAEPGFRVHIHIELTDVAHGQLLAGTMRVTGQLSEGIEPFTTRFRIEFHDEADERTRLEIRQWLPEDLAGPSEQGWLQAFTKLDAILTTDPATAAVHRNGATWAS